MGLEHSSSKKDHQICHKELLKIVQKPLEIFFEEKLYYYLLETKGNIVMKVLFIAIATQGTS